MTMLNMLWILALPFHGALRIDERGVRHCPLPHRSSLPQPLERGLLTMVGFVDSVSVSTARSPLIGVEP